MEQGEERERAMAVGSWKVSVPLGLDSALEGLTRAVLKQQPHDIYSFAATYFEDLLALRMRQMEAQAAGDWCVCVSIPVSKRVRLQAGLMLSRRAGALRTGSSLCCFLSYPQSMPSCNVSVWILHPSKPNTAP
ncbi:hypothetical protein LSTR_LSTR013936 [Laodelphax striatellus]|uniref:RIIa domain-containing protein n=1 Tax=Laodelphax striatellus TaxID=195883 RepID=A0A482WTA3_LAOST|nr:hypothetical protein LSTR_LSTR013936 [Laodelphax striatellus]